MTKSARLTLAVAVLALPVGASPIAGTKGPAEVHAPALAPKLHIKSFTILAPACNQDAKVRFEVQNLTGTPFEGNKTMSPTEGPELAVREVATSFGFQQALPAVGGGATVPITLSIVGRKLACPSDTCWEVGFFRAGPGGPSLPEWDGKPARICAKTSCNPHATKRTTPCTFEIYSPMP